MASIFLSYDREDADRVKRIALALEKAGHSVWWDRHIKSGAQYGREIDEALKRSDAVVVLWSKKSVESVWVRDEAATGRDAGKLVPAKIDEVDPPLGFRQYQTTDLTRWKGRRSTQFDEMLEAIGGLAAGSESKPQAAPPVAPTKRERWFGRPIAVLAALVALVAIGLLVWKTIGRPSSVPVIAVAAADPSAGSQTLARDLLVKLGTLQTSGPNAIDLISRDDTNRKPTFTFQVGRAGRGAAEANLALTDAKSRSLLWSKDFRDPNGSEADLRQQLAYTAAHVLRCALEGTDPASGRLPRQLLKIYLNACAHDPQLRDPTPLISAFRQLVREAPWFDRGWAGLMLSETAIAVDPVKPESEAMRRTLTKSIVEARKLHPHLAEAYFAEVMLTPDPQFLRRSRLLDESIRRNPDSSILRVQRSLFLQSVGLLSDAVMDARRAVDLDPLSPDARNTYIIALAFAGRIDEAQSELREAERLWPDATSIEQARYLLNLRVGDPREALRLLRSGVLHDATTDWVRLQEDYLHARIDRSPEKVEKIVQESAAVFSRVPRAVSGHSQILAEFGREEELFEILLNWRQMEIVTFVADVIFRPAFANAQKDPRFMVVAKRLGLLDYWRATGKWPDFCFRADLPYDCKEEAARLVS